MNDGEFNFKIIFKIADIDEFFECQKYLYSIGGFWLDDIDKNLFNEFGFYDIRKYGYDEIKEIKNDILLLMNNDNVISWIYSHSEYFKDNCIDWNTSSECRKFKLEKIFKK